MKFTVVVLGLLALVHEGASIFFLLGEKEHRCFFEDYQSEVLLKLEFNATLHKDSSSIGLEVVVVGPNKQLMLKKDYASQSTVSFQTSEAGEYAVCVSTNSTKWAMYATETVLVHFRFNAEYIHKEASEDDWKPTKTTARSRLAASVNDSTDGREDTPLSSLKKRLEDVKTDLNWITEMQDHYRYIEVEFRIIAEDTNSRVLIWAAAQLIILLTAGWWQMRSLKCFFKEKKLA